jgi:hypothetical protein
MATLQYRGSEVVSSDEAVVKPSIASYRGSTYNPQEVSSKAHKFTMSYRGTTLEV